MEFIKINEKDNVVIALRDFNPGEEIKLPRGSFKIPVPVPGGHKIAVEKISPGENVIKYGRPIGHAVREISPGEHVHTHNLKTNLGKLLEYKYHRKIEKYNSVFGEQTVKAYRRETGDVGIRNELWIIPTVGCVNGICDLIRSRFLEEVPSPEIDGIVVFPHNYGCSQLGDDHENTKRILQDMALHPNAGGVLVVGLGCENNQMEPFKEALTGRSGDRIKTLVTQEVEDEVEEGVLYLKEIYEKMRKDYREEVSIGLLKIGLECGGSDSLSGVTANPLLGEFSSYLVSRGGTSVLTEVPEMFGAETFLMEQAVDEEVFKKIVDLINDFKNYFIRHDQEIYENPSPGNKEGGITTLEEKSLGAVEKLGKGEIIDVIKYGERLMRKGLTLLSAPGNDLVATTALAASGCHLVIFTTGRGTPFGGPVPTLKVSTNSALFKKKKGWIDFNAGGLVEGLGMEEVAEGLIDLVVETANGKKTKNEINGFRNLAIFKSGVTL